MQHARIENISDLGSTQCAVLLTWVHGLEPAREHVVVACSQRVETQIAVEALATVEIRVRRGARAGDRRAESVERVRVRDCAHRVRQEAHVAMAVVAVEGGPGAPDELVLADELPTVGVRSRDCAIDDFVQHLRVASGVFVIHQVFRRSAADGLADAVAVAVVRNCALPSECFANTFMLRPVLTQHSCGIATLLS